jgi:hypothetical protein
MEYNRRRFVQSDIVSSAIKSISANIPERLSLLILTAAARSVHHVSPDKRVELLENVTKLFANHCITLIDPFFRLGKR